MARLRTASITLFSILCFAAVSTATASAKDQIFYSRESIDNGTKTRLMSTALGSGQADRSIFDYRLTQEFGSNNANPSLSPNRDRIVFSQKSAQDNDLDLFEADFDAQAGISNLRQLTDTPNVDEYYPVYHTEDEIAYVESGPVGDTIYFLKGDVKRRIISLPQFFGNLTFSPSGEQMAFTKGGDIVVIDLVRLGILNLGEGADASWSPTGEQLIYEKNSDIVSVAMRNGAPIESPVVTFKTLTKSGQNFDPAFSPDGKSIAFVSFRGDSPGDNIYVMSSNGENDGLTRVTSTNFFDSDPFWVRTADQPVGQQPLPPQQSANCASLERRSKKALRKFRKARRQARRAHGHKRARLLKKSRRQHRRAKRLALRASECS